MELDKSIELDKLVDEIATLKRKAKLLDKLLRYYDDKNKCWKPIKEKWDGRVRADKLPAPTPKEHLYKIINQGLTYDEKLQVGLYYMA